jgi:hypothetical protein
MSAFGDGFYRSVNDGLVIRGMETTSVSLTLQTPWLSGSPDWVDIELYIGD